MFERAIRLRQAERALAEGRYEEALQLAADPLVEGHRRALKVIQAAREGLLRRARERIDGGRFDAARRDLERAGGNATLTLELDREEKRRRGEAQARRDALHRARALVQAGFPGRALEILDALEPPEEGGGLRDRARRAVEQGRAEVARAGELLDAGRVEEAREAWHQAHRLDRSVTGREALERRLLRAWVDSWLGDPQEADSAWAALDDLLGQEPSLVHLPEVRERAATLAHALCDRAGAHIRSGDFTAARVLLDRLTGGPAATLAPPEATCLATLAEARMRAQQGRVQEGLGMARALVETCDEARRWVEEVEAGLADHRDLPLRALGAALEGRPQEGAALLAARADQLANPTVAALRRHLEELACNSRDTLSEARELLAEGQPRRALVHLVGIREAGAVEETLALANQALEAVHRAARSLGGWQAGVATVTDAAGVGELAARLAGVEELDREADGLDRAREEQGRLVACAAALERAGRALDEEDPVGAARHLAGEGATPPRTALHLLAAARNLLAHCAEGAIRGGVSPVQAATVIEALGRYSLTPDPALVRLAPAPEEGAGGRPVRAEAEADPREGFILRVAAAGDLLVLPRERLLIGSVAEEVADLRILARIRPRHAALSRSLSFHKGVTYRIEPVGDGPVRVGGNPTQGRALADGDRIELGPVFGFTFSRPCPGSASPLLSLQGDFEAEGCRRAIWMKSPGWDGAVTLGPGEGVHHRVRGARARVELCLDREGRLLCRSSEEILVDGRPAGSRETAVELGREVRSGGITIYLDRR